MIEHIYITPEIADRFLAKNANNRTLGVRLVDQYTRDMVSGNWPENGSTIVFDELGNLLDGQHRLAAIVQSKISQRMIVVTGVKAVSKDTIDTGRQRSAADNIKMKGLEYASSTAAAARLLMTCKNNTLLYRFSNREIMDFLDKYPELNFCAHQIGAHGKAFSVFPQRVIISWLFLASTQSPYADMAGNALQVLLTGVPSYDGDAMHSVRERVIRATVNEFTSRATCFYLFSTMNAAWNNFVKQIPIKNTKIRATMVQIDGFNMENL